MVDINMVIKRLQSQQRGLRQPRRARGRSSLSRQSFGRDIQQESIRKGISPQSIVARQQQEKREKLISQEARRQEEFIRKLETPALKERALMNVQDIVREKINIDIAEEKKKHREAFQKELGILRRKLERAEKQERRRRDDDRPRSLDRARARTDEAKVELREFQKIMGRPDLFELSLKNVNRFISDVGRAERRDAQAYFERKRFQEAQIKTKAPKIGVGTEPLPSRELTPLEKQMQMSFDPNFQIDINPEPIKIKPPTKKKTFGIDLGGFFGFR